MNVIDRRFFQVLPPLSERGKESIENRETVKYWICEINPKGFGKRLKKQFSFVLKRNALIMNPTVKLNENVRYQ